MLRTRLTGVLAAAAALVLPLAAHQPTATASSPHHPVAVARQATDKFHDLTVANRHGYSLFKDQEGIACIAMHHMGAMGIHYVKSSLVADPAVRLRHPEALVYDPEDGQRRLVALEYLVLKRDWEEVHGAGAARPRLYGHRFDVTRAGNRFGLPTFYSLHAWIWRHNPAGRFAMFNPRVDCHR